MELQQYVDLITFTSTIQRVALPSAILGDAHVYASMCVPLHICIIHTEIQTHTHTLHCHTNTISYKPKIFQQKKLQNLNSLTELRHHQEHQLKHHHHR